MGGQPKLFKEKPATLDRALNGIALVLGSCATKATRHNGELEPDVTIQAPAPMVKSALVNEMKDKL